MPRTAITVTSASPWLVGANATATTGDPTPNNHTVDLNNSPKLVLVALNLNAATVDFTIELPAVVSTYNIAQSISHTIPAAVGGVPGVRFVPLDSPSIAQSGNVLHIDSADANFGDVRFYVLTWAPTPR